MKTQISKPARVRTAGVMARPLRIECPGACYHLMNRGDRRQNIFRVENGAANQET